ncbi:MAG: tRNA (adenosine(37)-N6)-threonylcarbamoyltransferase complex ATPase subunit type 1 TsaE [Candidatus Eremiobacteraeota bacterium]|nr:tRNA (adenosine(37)-N6)-threonylcarbamoyltransferase complex ATPase subunit type 1 TsaE [Candidatus Eremiobacteraeota bacterium]
MVVVGFAKAMERTFQTEAHLRAFGAEFALRLKPGDVVGLSGGLGAGKTTLVQAIVSARLGHDPTSSPTFTFWHRYEGTPPIDHLDLYRIEDARELTELGLDEAFDGHSIVLVEWWANAPELLPARRYELELAGAGDEPRGLRLREPT